MDEAKSGWKVQNPHESSRCVVFFSVRLRSSEGSMGDHVLKASQSLKAPSHKIEIARQHQVSGSSSIVHSPLLPTYRFSAGRAWFP